MVEAVWGSESHVLFVEWGALRSSCFLLFFEPGRPASSGPGETAVRVCGLQRESYDLMAARPGCWLVGARIKSRNDAADRFDTAHTIEVSTNSTSSSE